MLGFLGGQWVRVKQRSNRPIDLLSRGSYIDCGPYFEGEGEDPEDRKGLHENRHSQPDNEVDDKYQLSCLLLGRTRAEFRNHVIDLGEALLSELLVGIAVICFESLTRVPQGLEDQCEVLGREVVVLQVVMSLSRQLFSPIVNRPVDLHGFSCLLRSSHRSRSLAKRCRWSVSGFLEL